MNILVTGGCGFIGTNFILKLLQNERFNVFNIDNLTYASNNFLELNSGSYPKYNFLKGDICNESFVRNIINDFKPNYLINFAAESHVDNSIKKSREFLDTNFFGTYNLLEASRDYFSYLKSDQKKYFKFHQISTDEVYGDMIDELFHEKSRYLPSSPYSATKASADHLVRSWQRTYDLPCIVTCCSNNYGPFQFSEKLVPLIIKNALDEKDLPIYGDGKQVRDWIYVEDHCDALIKCIDYSVSGETYNIGSNNQTSNIELVTLICENLDLMKPRAENKKYIELIKHVTDRPGHDRKYGIDSTKTKRDLQWEPKITLLDGIKKTINWYMNNYLG